MDFRIGFLGVLLVLIFSFVFAAPWDGLRPVVGGLSVIEPVVVWLVFFVSLALVIISFLAWRKKNSEKLLWVLAAFVLFFLKSFLLALDLYVSPGNFFNYSVQSLFDLLIIAGLFVALFRK